MTSTCDADSEIFIPENFAGDSLPESIRAALMKLPAEFPLEIFGRTYVVRRARYTDLRLRTGGSMFCVYPSFTLHFDVEGVRKQLLFEVKTEYVVCRSEDYTPTAVAPLELFDIAGDEHPLHVIRETILTTVRTPYKAP